MKEHDIHGIRKVDKAHNDDHLGSSAAMGYVVQEISGGMEEVYCMWWDCPSCEYSYIMKTHKFCPDCGVKLIFDF